MKKLTKKQIVLISVSVVLVLSAIIGAIVISGKNKTDVFTVVFDSQGGTSIKSQSVEKGSTIIEPKDPVKQGFTFIEWQNNGMKFDFETPIDNDVVLIAVYLINEGTEIVTVTLDYQNGEKLGFLEIIKGGKTTEPPTPHKQGYKFIGWYVDNVEFDFSSNINESITLFAKWEIDNSTTESKKNNIFDKINDSKEKNDTINNNTTDNDITTSPNDVLPEISDSPSQMVLDYEETMLPYAGKWYLKGYADVYISLSNIYESGGWAYFDLSAANFALPLDSNRSSPVAPYTVYPYDAFVDNPTEEYWSNGFNVLCDPSVWQEEIAKHDMKLGNNCIYLGGKQFVREKGSISMYDDTCYKAALGDWYMEGNPDSHLNIWKRQDLDTMGDYVEISMWNFNINTLVSSGNGNVRLYAARKNNWDKYGVQVNNGVLTISNGNGTKKFHRNAIKITSKTDIHLSVGETEKLYTIVLPQSTTEQSVTWTSSDPSVATVSGSVVKAIGKGTATLTVTSKVGGHKATCKITVTEPPLTVTAHISDGVEISGSSMYGIVTASMNPSGGSGKYTTCVLKLYHNDILISETNEKSITVRKQTGEYRVEVYVIDSSGNKATATKKIYL